MKLTYKRFSGFAAVLMLTILPYYAENAYFNIVEAKFHAFFAIAALLFIPALYFTVYYLLKREGDKRPCFDLCDTAVVSYAAISLLSCLLSGRIKESFWGNEGWYIGAFTLCTLALFYFFFKYGNTDRKKLCLALCLVYIPIFILGILQFAGIDPLGFHDNIIEKQYYQYISTYGNTNWYAGCLCMLIPMAFVFFSEAKGRFSYGVNLVFLTLALWNLLISVADGAYIGLGFCLFFAIPFICRSKQRIKRALTISLVFFSESALIALLPCYKGLLEKASGISAIFLELKFSLPLLCLSLLFLIMASVTKNDSERLRKGICIGAELILAMGVLSAFVYTVINFSDSFGSSRGAIWRVSFENFSSYGIKEKLIGIGPELLKNEYAELQKGLFRGLAILSSHSEPIQALLTTGVLGIVSWLAVFAGALVNYIKGNKAPLDLAFFLPVTAYFAQSFINSATMANLCLLCVILALQSSKKLPEKG